MTGGEGLRFLLAARGGTAATYDGPVTRKAFTLPACTTLVGKALRDV